MSKKIKTRVTTRVTFWVSRCYVDFPKWADKINNKLLYAGDRLEEAREMLYNQFSELKIKKRKK